MSPLKGTVPPHQLWASESAGARALQASLGRAAGTPQPGQPGHLSGFSHGVASPVPLREGVPAPKLVQVTSRRSLCDQALAGLPEPCS